MLGLVAERCVVGGAFVIGRVVRIRGVRGWLDVPRLACVRGWSSCVDLSVPSLRLRLRGVVRCVAWVVAGGGVRVLWSVVSRFV